LGRDKDLLALEGAQPLDCVQKLEQRGGTLFNGAAFASLERAEVAKDTLFKLAMQKKKRISLSDREKITPLSTYSSSVGHLEAVVVEVHDDDFHHVDAGDECLTTVPHDCNVLVCAEHDLERGRLGAVAQFPALQVTIKKIFFPSFFFFRTIG